MNDAQIDGMALAVRSESPVELPECGSCGSSKPCIMCMGSRVRPWSGLGFVNCPACWGTGIDHD